MVNDDTIIWMSAVQMEFCSDNARDSRRIAFCTINKLFQGCSITIHRCNIHADSVNVHRLDFVQDLFDWSFHVPIKRTFKSMQEAKAFIKEKSIDGNYILFDLKNRDQKEKNNRRIELISRGKLEKMMTDYVNSVEMLNNLFQKFE